MTWPGGLVASTLIVIPLAGCGRFAFDPSPTTDAGRDAPTDADVTLGTGIAALHLYELNNSFADTFGGPSLAGAGGTFNANGYAFGENQGFTVDGALPKPVYTIDIIFSFADVALWQKILDFDGRQTDEGLYVYKGALQFVIVSGADFISGAPVLVPDQRMRVTLTRDASMHVVGYMDGVLVVADRATMPEPPAAPSGTFELDDTTDIATVEATTATFFIDDVATNIEASPGTVRRVAIWDVALTPAQVAAVQ